MRENNKYCLLQIGLIRVAHSKIVVPNTCFKKHNSKM